MTKINLKKEGTLDFIKSDNEIVKINIAFPRSSEVGLMYVKHLPDDIGMLFSFKNETKLNFWMRNTYVPLDMIFANKDKIIVHIYKNAKPLSTTGISSVYPSKFVVEVNAGFCDKNNIKEGDFIFFRYN